MREQLKMNSLIVYKELIQRYIKEILNTFEDKVQAATVFGSVARGEARDDSDIDMLIIVSNDRRKIQEAIVPAVDLKVDDWAEYKRILEKGIRTKIFEIIKTEKELRDNPLILLDILDHGKILYDPKCVMKNLLKDFNKKLKDLGAKKIVFEDGKWCWDLKPDWKPGEIVEIKL